MELIKIERVDGELYADSRMVAEVLGIERKSMNQLIHDRESTLGILRFENAEIKGRGQPEKYALLTERQCLLLITMVRNTTEALEAKTALVDAFIKMRESLIAPAIPTGPELLALAVLEAQKVIAQKDALIESQKPAVQFYNDVTGSRDAIDMGQVAKVLGIGMGRNTLFDFLRKNGVLRENNEPYQRYIDNKWFRVVEQKYQDGNGETKINIKTLIFQKGLEGISKLIRGKRQSGELNI